MGLRKALKRKASQVSAKMSKTAKKLKPKKKVTRDGSTITDSISVDSSDKASTTSRGSHRPTVEEVEDEGDQRSSESDGESEIEDEEAELGKCYTHCREKMTYLRL